MTTSTFIVDAFTSTLLKGNQAAVCIVKEEKTDAWMQAVAAEFDLSETAFLTHEQNNQWHLRWFTPDCEVNLCGHATLAAAHVLARELKENHEVFEFSTLSGILKAYISESVITLDFPKITPELLSGIYVHDSGLQTLGLKVKNYYRAGEDILLELHSESDIADYVPELEKIALLDARGLIITAPSATSERDFVSRFFAPVVGINEDPVTGSAHCSLAVLWSKQLDKSYLRAHQLSKRGGQLDLRVNSNSVNLIGQCRTFLRGELIC